MLAEGTFYRNAFCHLFFDIGVRNATSEGQVLTIKNVVRCQYSWPTLPEAPQIEIVTLYSLLQPPESHLDVRS